MPTQPQDRRPSARKQTESSKKREKEATDEALDRGLSITDDDGTRLEVRLRDVKGGHEAALIAESGFDFQSLLSAMMNSQSAYNLGCMLWFARLVNNRPGPSFKATIDAIGYADYLERDVDEPSKVERPKASANSSSTPGNSPT